MVRSVSELTPHKTVIITDIKRQAKRGDRYSIFIDDSYSFSLDELELSASTLKVGIELSEAEIADWRSKSAAGKAYDASLRYLSLRQRSRVEIEKYLTGKEYDSVTIEETIQRLEGLGLIDDVRFARAWVSDRNRLRPRSKLVLRSELMGKGISREVIDEILAEMSAEGEIEVLKRLIDQKAHRYDSTEKLMAYLASKGFSYGQIKAALLDDSRD